MSRINLKSQISIFIIIGIILIIISSFLFYNNKFEIFVSHDTKLKNQISDVVKNCIEKSAEQGVFLLGFQGGYINLSKPRFSVPSNYLDLGLKIPNWDSSKNQIPTIKSMENELNSYIINDANSCIIENLKNMRDYFDIKIKSNLKVNTTINPSNVIIESNLPIDFNEKNSKTILSVEDYYINLDGIKLGSMYDLAVDIYNLESRTNFLESLVLDQIYSAGDYSHPSNSMPTEGMVLSCAPSYWTIPELKNTLAKLNNNNFKYLYFEGTKSKEDLYKNSFKKELGTEGFEKYYEKYYTFKLDENNEIFKNFGVDVVMPSSQITGKHGYFESNPFREFKVTPSNGLIVKPKKLKIDAGGLGKIPIPCIQIFHSLYSLDYDLLFTIKDYSEDGKGYYFQFPMRIVIKNNNPKTLSKAPILKEAPLLTNEKYCSNKSRKYEVPVFITDKNTGDTITGVDITYKCINLECDLGKTKNNKYHYNSDNAKLIAKFPFCSGGSIIASKKGYATRKYIPDKDPYTFQKDSIAYYEFSLIPTKTFIINKFSIFSIIKETRHGKRILDNSNESVYVSIENKENDFSSFAIYPSDNGFNKLEFLDGNYSYNISIIYVDKNNNLKGIFEEENVFLDPNNGNNIKIIFPSSINEINDKNFMDFYKYMEMIKDSKQYGIFFK